MTANVLAAAIEVLTGKPARAVCVWCLHRHDPHELAVARRVPSGGDCSLCPYSDDGSGLGSDMFVAVLPDLKQCPVQALAVQVVQRHLEQGE